MKPMGGRALLAVGLVAAVVAWAGLGVLDDSGVALPLPWTAPAVLGVLAAAILAVGWPVRRWVRGSRDRPLDPLRAARAAVLAQAASTTGAALVGVYAGWALVLVPTVAIEPRRADLVRALLALVAAAALLVVGILVERWCRLPPGDDERRRSGGADAGGRGEVADDAHSHQRPPGSRGHPGGR